MKNKLIVLGVFCVALFSLTACAKETDCYTSATSAGQGTVLRPVGCPRVENRPLPYFVNQSFDIPPAQRYSYYIKKTQQTGQVRTGDGSPSWRSKTQNRPPSCLETTI